jgi:hypothetical protein
MTEEEIEKIVGIATERMLLRIPGIMGNLMKNHAVTSKLTSQFYRDYPEFVEHKHLVAKAIEQTELANPADKYEDLLTKAVPEIRKSLKIKQSINVDSLEPLPDYGVL